MKLSNQELSWLHRWEKRERLWVPITRWVCALNGVVCLVGGFYLLKRLAAFDEVDLAALAWLGGFGGFLLVMAGMWFGFAFSKWSGDIKLRLLLRLIREHQDKEA